MSGQITESSEESITGSAGICVEEGSFDVSTASLVCIADSSVMAAGSSDVISSLGVAWGRAAGLVGREAILCCVSYFLGGVGFLSGKNCGARGDGDEDLLGSDTNLNVISASSAR